MLGRLTRLSFSGPAFLANANFRCVSVSKSPRFFSESFRWVQDLGSVSSFQERNSQCNSPSWFFSIATWKKVSNSKWVPWPLFLVGKTLIKLIHSWGFSRHLCWVSQKFCVFSTVCISVEGRVKKHGASWRDIAKCQVEKPFTSTHWDVFLLGGNYHHRCFGWVNKYIEMLLEIHERCLVDFLEIFHEILSRERSEFSSGQVSSWPFPAE